MVRSLYSGIAWTSDPGQLLSDLTEAVDAMHRAQADRDAMIRRGRELNITMRELAKAARMTPGRVHQITHT